MPRGDNTGPEGRGPMTGRQMGLCAGQDAPGYATTTEGPWDGGPPRGGRGRGARDGRGRGGGYGRGRGRWRGQGRPPVAATTTPRPESIEAPETDAQGLRRTLDAIVTRLDALEAGQAPETADEP